MPNKLETTNVFLDTEVFVAAQFNLKSPKLAEIRKLASEEKIHILMPETAVKECKKRITKMVASAVNFLKDKDNRQTIGVLKQIKELSESVIWTLDKKALCAETTEALENYLRESKAIICPLKNVSIETLFADYDAGNPPFGEGQKKDQFPDAVAMLGLLDWCKANRQTLYVISKDPDIKAVCEAHPEIFIYREQVGEFLDDFNRHEQLAQTILRIIELKLAQIEREFIEAFEDSAFHVSGEDGDVNEVKVESVEFGRVSIIALEDNYAQVEIPLEVNFKADVSYDDSSTGSYDSEEGRMFGMETVDETVEQTNHIGIEIEIEYDKNSPEDAKLDFHLGEGDYEVDVGDDPRDYK